jgi:hypothetical protein
MTAALTHRRLTPPRCGRVEPQEACGVVIEDVALLLRRQEVRGLDGIDGRLDSLWPDLVSAAILYPSSWRRKLALILALWLLLFFAV